MYNYIVELPRLKYTTNNDHQANGFIIVQHENALIGRTTTQVNISRKHINNKSSMCTKYRAKQLPIKTLLIISLCSHTFTLLILL